MASWKFHQQRHLTWTAGLGRFHRAEHGFIMVYPQIPPFLSIYYIIYVYIYISLPSFPFTSPLQVAMLHLCTSPDPSSAIQTQTRTTQVAGEFLMLKHLASNGKADPDAHLKRIKAGRLLARWRLRMVRMAYTIQYTGNDHNNHNHDMIYYMIYNIQ